MFTIRVLLIDDHDLVRQMLVERLGREQDLEVVGAAATAEEGVSLAAHAKPDVVVMDIGMPGVSPFEAARQIRALVPTAGLIFLSGFVSDRYVRDALAAGATGYLTKTEPPARVADAIREVAAGRSAFSEDVQSRMVFDDRNPRVSEAQTTRMATLSPREVEVLRYVARGLATKEIAQVMHLSPKTVDNHRTKLMEKLGIHDRVELTRFAIREGLTEA
jgi:DNA-binding NarL/FixJ family response regulator